MTDEDEMVEYTYLNIDPRAYQYIRQSAIKDIYDGLLELITNSVDAYNSPYFNPDGSKIIHIELNEIDNTLCLYDNAIGLPGDKMKTYFLTVGAYTSRTGARGYFSRGAKDLCTIGNVHFRSIYNDTYSECRINTLAQGAVIAYNIPVTDQQRKELGILTGNGLSVLIQISDVFNYDTMEVFMNLENHFALRNILADTSIDMVLKIITKDNLVLEKQLVYKKPESELIIDMEYDLTSYGYDGITAKFELNLATDHQKEILGDMKFEKYGILISSEAAIHENSYIHYTLRNNPNFNRLIGKIECTYINDLMYDLDETGPTVKNPFPIINSSRQYGLEKAHPFTKALLDIPYKRILYVLTQLDDETSNNFLSTDNINNLLSNLEILGDNIVQTLNSNLVNITITEKLVEKITQDVSSGNITENDSLSFSQKNIEKDIVLNPDGIIKTRPKFQIKFSKVSLGYKYKIYTHATGIILSIDLTNDIIKDYIQMSNDDIVGLNELTTRILMVSIISEAFTRIISENILENKENIDLGSLWRKYQEIMNKVEINIYNVLVKETSRFTALTF